MKKHGLNDNLVIVAVLLVAAVLRLQAVNQAYVDEYAWREADTASMADAFSRGDWNIFLPQVRWGGPGPNYVGAEFQTVSYLTAIGYQAFGAAPWVGRGVSIAFGLWGVFALYQLVRRVWDEPRAVAAAAVMAVLPGSVFIERSFLSDGAMTSLMTTSLWMLVAWCQTEKSGYLVLAAVFGALGCLTKLPGGILLIPALYVLVALLGTRLGKPGIQRRLGVATITIFVPVITYYLWARHVALTNPPYHFTGEGKFIWDQGISVWLTEAYYLPVLWQIIVGEKGLWGYPFTLLGIVGLILPLSPGERCKGMWLFHFWVLALLLRYLIEARHLVSDPYNLHLFNVPISVFAGYALVTLAKAIRRISSHKFGTAVAVSILIGSAVYGQYRIRPLFADSYHDHYALGKSLDGLLGPTDLVVSFGSEPVVLYHSRRQGWIFPSPPGISQPYATWDYGANDLALLDDHISKGATWLAIPSWNSYTGGSGQDFLRQHYPSLYAGLVSRFDLVSDLPYGMIYRVKRADGGASVKGTWD